MFCTCASTCTRTYQSRTAAYKKQVQKPSREFAFKSPSGVHPKKKAQTYTYNDEFLKVVFIRLLRLTCERTLEGIPIGNKEILKLLQAIIRVSHFLKRLAAKLESQTI